MPKTLVTGATGFLGSHLLERLIDKGVELKVLARGEPSLPGGVEVVPGSILDGAAVRTAVSDVDRIYHLAGKVSRSRDDAREMYRLHVEGTQILCRAAREKDSTVERILLASTSGTIAVSDDPDRRPDERSRPPIELIGRWPYYTSKLYQEEAARRELSGGPELVIVNPSLLLGPGDHRLSSTEDVLKFLAGDIPVVPPGGVNFVDVRDVADACFSAMERGGAGERYLLGGPNWSFKTFFEKLARMSGVKGPKLRLPESVYGIASAAVDAIYKGIERTPPVDRVSAEMGERFWYFDSRKAEREIGFEARDPYETLHETIQFIKATFLGESVFSAR